MKENFLTELQPTCFSSGMAQLVSTAFLSWATVSRARFISSVIILPVSTRNMYNILNV